MALMDEAKDLAEYIDSKKHYLARNAQLFDIYEGNLRPYVDRILRESLSEQYYSKIKDRIYPINILKRLIDKLSRVYQTRPNRNASSDQEILESYEQLFMLNRKMNTCDEFINLFKGYALEPFIENNMPKLRTIPFDRFLVKSTNILDPLAMTHFMKFVGKKSMLVRGAQKEVDVWFVYTKDEFLAISHEGHILPEFMKDNDGVNPYGFIPFFFSARSEHSLLPTQDTDTLELAKLMPVQFSDLAGGIMFSVFSIVWGIDVDSENMIMSPNAFWSMKSDPSSDKTPQIGVIKPQIDVEKVLSFIKETFSTWLETRGIRVGNIGSPDGQSFASGVSKIIDEMDTFEAINKQMEAFKYDEYAFWQLVKDLHNKWIEFGELRGVKMLPDNWEVFTEFDRPKPATSPEQQLEMIIKKIDNELLSKETAMKLLYPDWTDEEIQEELDKIEEQDSAPVAFNPFQGNVNGMDKNEDTNQEEV